jgi:hypothetical protein
VGGEFKKVIEGKADGDIEEVNYTLLVESRLKLCSSLLSGCKGDICGVES